MRKAVDWVRSNRALFKGQVMEPLFFNFPECEKQHALQVLHEDQDEDAKESFLFRFTKMQDMELFLGQCRDKEDLLVNTKCI